MADKELSMWRGSVIYLGKLTGVHNTIFLRASTKEKAEKFISQRVRKYYKTKGMKNVQFKLLSTKSSDDEAFFFQEHAANRQYTGLMN